MFTSFEHFKATTKTTYDTLRGNPAMKLSAYRQTLAGGLGFKNCQSLKRHIEAQPSTKAKLFVADHIADVFDNCIVADAGCTKEFIIQDEGTCCIINTHLGDGGEEYDLPLSTATAKLYDGELTVMSDGVIIDTYSVFVRHTQPVVIQNKAFLIYVNGQSDVALYLNGEQMSVADTAAGDDSDLVIETAKSLMLALGVDLTVVDVDDDNGDWGWSEVSMRVLSTAPSSSGSDHITGIKTRPVLTSVRDKFFG